MKIEYGKIWSVRNRVMLQMTKDGSQTPFKTFEHAILHLMDQHKDEVEITVTSKTREQPAPSEAEKKTKKKKEKVAEEENAEKAE